MPVPTYQLTCLQNDRIARGVHQVKLQKPEGFTFRPGQFVLFEIALQSNPEDKQTRAFSLASHPDEQDLLFVIKLKEGGRASTWLEQGLHAGDTVTVKGPFGLFKLDQENSKNILFLCTGAGLAPFQSMILDERMRDSSRAMDVIFGVRSEEDLFWAEELVSLSQQIEGLKVHMILTQPSEAWTGHKGRIQHVAPLIVPDLARRQVYVCGNPDMTTEVKKLCLEEWGVLKEDLHVEGYI